MAIDKVWVLAEAGDAGPTPITLELLTEARSVATTVEAVAWGTETASLAAALASFFPPNAVVYAAGILLCGLLGWLSRVKGAYRFAGITLSIVLLIPHAHDPWMVAWHRFLEVSLGIAVALAVTTAWPLVQKTP